MFAQGTSMCDSAVKAYIHKGNEPNTTRLVLKEGVSIMEDALSTSSTPQWSNLLVLLNYKRLATLLEGHNDTQKSEVATICPVAARTTFDEVKGGKLMQKAKDTMRQFTVLPLQFPELFRGSKGGVLLYGVPGTGKTTLAEAASNASLELPQRGLGDCGTVPALPMFTAGVSDIKSQYVGEGEKNLSRYIQTAADASPSILFFDEADALFDPSDKNNAGLINTFKQEVGGFGAKDMNVVVMFATNHPMAIDGAIRSRLGVSIEIPLPNLEARMQIAKRTLSSLAEYDETVPMFIAEATKPPMYASNVRMQKGLLYSGRDIDTVCRQVHSQVLSQQTGMRFVKKMGDGFIFQQSGTMLVSSLSVEDKRKIKSRAITSLDAKETLDSYNPTVKDSDVAEQVEYNRGLGVTHESKGDLMGWIRTTYGVTAVEENLLDYVTYPAGVNTTVPES